MREAHVSTTHSIPCAAEPRNLPARACKDAEK
jgi:hypothetical protein